MADNNDQLERRIYQLEKTVQLGNGKPSLVERQLELETSIRELRTRHTECSAADDVGELNKAFDSFVSTQKLHNQHVDDFIETHGQKSSLLHQLAFTLLPSILAFIFGIIAYAFVSYIKENSNHPHLQPSRQTPSELKIETHSNIG